MPRHTPPPPYREIKLGQLADALMRGITRYFAKNPPLTRNRTV